MAKISSLLPSWITLVILVELLFVAVVVTVAAVVAVAVIIIEWEVAVPVAVGRLVNTGGRKSIMSSRK